MLEKTINYITIFSFAFIVFTYGPWFVAGFYDWDNGGRHGCLRLRVSPSEIQANIISGIREESGRIGTKIVDSVPILFWVGNAVFEISDESRKQDGFARMSLGFTQLELESSYSGNDPFSEVTVYKRVSKCSDDMKVYPEVAEAMD